MEKIRPSADQQGVPVYRIQSYVSGIPRLTKLFSAVEVQLGARLKTHPSHWLRQMQCVQKSEEKDFGGKASLWQRTVDPREDRSICQQCQIPSKMGCIIYDAATGESTAAETSYIRP